MNATRVPCSCSFSSYYKPRSGSTFETSLYIPSRDPGYNSIHSFLDTSKLPNLYIQDYTYRYLSLRIYQSNNYSIVWARNETLAVRFPFLNDQLTKPSANLFIAYYSHKKGMVRLFRQLNLKVSIDLRAKEGVNSDGCRMPLSLEMFEPSLQSIREPLVLKIVELPNEHLRLTRISAAAASNCNNWR